MSKLVTRFAASSGPVLLRMDVFYGEDFGSISMLEDGQYGGRPPKDLPLNIWMRCLYRFNRVASQMLKPIEDGTEENSSI